VVSSLWASYPKPCKHLSPHPCATCLILLDLITLTIFSKEYRLQSSSYVAKEYFLWRTVICLEDSCFFFLFCQGLNSLILAIWQTRQRERDPDFFHIFYYFNEYNIWFVIYYLIVIIIFITSPVSCIFLLFMFFLYVSCLFWELITMVNLKLETLKCSGECSCFIFGRFQVQVLVQNLAALVDVFHCFPYSLQENAEIVLSKQLTFTSFPSDQS
jgi:hypothetical protein